MPVKGITSANNAYLTTNTGGVYLASYDSLNSELVWETLDLNVSLTQIVFSLPTTITAINNITFYGLFEIQNRGENYLQATDLVIYNANDPELQTSLLTLLSYFDTNSKGEVINFRDIRLISNVKNEPVAKWLTSLQDENLKYYYRQFKKYAELWMNPEKAGESIYIRELI